MQGETVLERLQELGIELPEPAAAVASYRPWIRAGDLLFISGQLPLRDGRPIAFGHLGDDISLERGQQCAELCAINCIAQAHHALEGDLERVERVVKLTGFVAATPDFTQHPQVINGASELIEKIFGERGWHARAAIGCSSLPLGVPVEVEAVFQVR